ncbi:hypothetical protein, conserved [Angomonas deanei]|uniref:Uncharacterized protein n=1 Tax=Angomonas deanei TaxID=59799 RepID=A0A7G2CPV7_9TRYP|nr:hypothetical protein, conserved [Angomonas deanei]
MSNNKISLYERYIFSKDVSTFLGSLVRNSPEYRYYYLLNELNSRGLRLTGDAKEELSSYVKDRTRDTSDLIVLKQRLLQLEELKAKGASGEAELSTKLRDFDKQYLGTSFDYSRPAVARNPTGGEAVSEDDTYKSSLDEKLVTLKDIVADAEERLDVSGLRGVAVYAVDLRKALSRDVEFFERVLSRLPTVAHLGETLVELLVSYRERCSSLKYPREPTGLNRSLFEKMTLEQLGQLAKRVPTMTNDNEFVARWFSKLFHKEMELLGRREEVLRRSYEELHDMYRRMYEWSAAVGDRKEHRCLAAMFLQRMLVLDLEHHRTDPKTLVLYLENPVSSSGLYSEARQTWLAENRADCSHMWQGALGLQEVRLPETDIVTEYLTNVLSRTPSRIDVGPYVKYFDQKTLNAISYRVGLFAGLDVSPAASGLSAGELEHLQCAKRLTFARWCRRSFSPDESVELTLEVKNISQLSVRVFEIHTENYYRRFGEEISSSVSVKGLVPSRTEEMTFDKPSCVVHEVPLKDLTGGRRGAFVVECVGSGVECRALVQVGALTLIERPVSKGVVFYMVDEAKRLCHGKETRMRMREKEYVPSEELGYGMLVPYGDVVRGNAVLCHDGFADLYAIDMREERVSVDMTVVVHEGTVADSGYTKLLVCPRVVSGGVSVSASVMRNVEVTVRSSDANGVRSAQVYKDVELSGTVPTVELSYLVPPFTESVSVELRGQVYSVKREDWDDVEAARSVRVERLRNVQSYADALLRMKEDGGYALHFVGKDGESYAGMKVKLSITSYFKDECIETVLRTDGDGVIDLGELSKYASRLRVETLDTPSPELLPGREYDLSTDTRSVTDQLVLVSGETVSLPVPSDCAVDGVPAFELVRVSPSQGEVVSRHSDAVAVKDGAYCVDGLDVGVYRFTYTRTGRRVNVRVVEGRRWDVAPDRYVEQRDCIVDLGSRVAGLAVSGGVSGGTTVELTVNPCGGTMDGVRVHALAYTYYPTTLGTLKNALGGTARRDRTYRLKFHENHLGPQSQMDEETKYVMDRKRRRGMVGNTLEKPPGLLKRHLVRDTKESEQPAYEEEMMKDRVHELARNGAPNARMKRRRPPAPAAFGCAANYDVGAQLMQQKRADLTRGADGNEYYVETLTNFAKNSGWVQYNMVPDASGKVRFDVPADCGYRTVVYIAQNDVFCTVGVVSVAGKKVETPLRPIALPSSRAAGRVYVTQRLSVNLDQNGSLSIPLSSTFSLVDCVSSAANGMLLVNPHTGLEGKWSFLTRWGSMTALEKLEKYDKLLCHELHWFVYLKDREFFDVVVRPHLESKSRKQLMDWLLLGDVKAVKRYVESVPVSTLTSLEKALIVRQLHGEEPEMCRGLAAGLAREVAAESDGTTEERDRRFDCILSGDATQQEGDEEAAVEVEGTDAIEADEADGAVHVMGGFGGAPPPGAMARGGFFAAPMAPQMSLASMNNNYLERAIATSKVTKYRPKGVTQEFEETQFAEGSRLPYITGLPFWSAVAAHFSGASADKPFVSETFMYATDNLTESVIALAVLDVPLRKGAHDVVRGTDGVTVRAGAPCVAFYRTLEEKGDERSDCDVIMSQRFVDPSDMYVFDTEKNTQTLKTVKEFTVGKLYGTRVSVTNTSDSSCNVRVVTEVPQGSIPVLEHEFTKDNERRLQPLATTVEMLYFYFPREGTFTCMPASVNHDGKLACSAGDMGKLRVVRTPTTREMQTLSDILSQGDEKDVLAFIVSKNWYDRRVFAPEAVYWLLTRRSFYESLLAHLRRSSIFDRTVWSFSAYHGDYDTFGEYVRYLAANKELSAPVFCETQYLKCGMLVLDAFEYKEYSPLANARVHDVGKYAHNIRNDEFRETYETFLRYWIEKMPNDVTGKDRLFLTTYLLLQDRVEDATAQYDLIERDALVRDGGGAEMALQYDYLTAYLDIYRGGPEYRRAREACGKYLTYPVFEWRNRFVDVLNLLAECSGETVSGGAPVGEESDAARNAREMKSEPTLSCEVKAGEGKVVATAGHVKSVCVSAFEVDLELLFSEDPFLDVSKMDYSYLMPNWKTTKAVRGDVSEVVVVDLPAELKSRNLVVRVDAGPLCETMTYLPCEMKVEVRREYGVVKVTELLNAHKPLPCVYVKAYARQKDGTVKFFKDGYTDLRGCVEYTSVNHTTDFSGIASFSLLVMSDERGATVVQTGPPSGLGTLEATTRQLVSTAMQMQQAQMVSAARNQYML